MDQNLVSSKMQKALEVLRGDLSTVRTGRAAPNLLENVSVSVYGGSTKLRIIELGTISAQDSQTLTITPFDPSIIDEIRKGIADSGLGLNPVVDGAIIRISIPPLSQDRREELIHLMHQKLENARVMIRQIRHDGMSEAKKEENLSEDDEKRWEKEIQTLTDKFIEEIDALGSKKEEELLQI